MGTNPLSGDAQTRRPESAAGMLVETHMGWVCAVARAGRLVATCLPMATQGEAVDACGIETDLEAREGLLVTLADDLRRYFAGQPVDLARHPVDLSDQPPFHRRALLAARHIPYGQIRTYGWVAAHAGRPNAARAAGQAMKRNPVPLVIPCHRVVGAGGALGGFGGGIETKRALLRLEGIHRSGRGLGSW